MFCKSQNNFSHIIELQYFWCFDDLTYSYINTFWSAEEHKSAGKTESADMVEASAIKSARIWRAIL